MLKRILLLPVHRNVLIVCSAVALFGIGTWLAAELWTGERGWEFASANGPELSSSASTDRDSSDNSAHRHMQAAPDSRPATRLKSASVNPPSRPNRHQPPRPDQSVSPSYFAAPIAARNNSGKGPLLAIKTGRGSIGPVVQNPGPVVQNPRPVQNRIAALPKSSSPAFGKPRQRGFEPPEPASSNRPLPGNGANSNQRFNLPPQKASGFVGPPRPSSLQGNSFSARPGLPQTSFSFRKYQGWAFQLKNGEVVLADLASPAEFKITTKYGEVTVASDELVTINFKAQDAQNKLKQLIPVPSLPSVSTFRPAASMPAISPTQSDESKNEAFSELPQTQTSSSGVSWAERGLKRPEPDDAFSGPDQQGQQDQLESDQGSAASKPLPTSNKGMSGNEASKLKGNSADQTEGKTEGKAATASRSQPKPKQSVLSANDSPEASGMHPQSGLPAKSIVQAQAASRNVVTVQAATRSGEVFIGTCELPPLKLRFCWGTGEIDASWIESISNRKHGIQKLSVNPSNGFLQLNHSQLQTRTMVLGR